MQEVTVPAIFARLDDLALPDVFVHKPTDAEPMKVLFFTNSNEDYLADAVFHGFRSLYGADCVDYPKSEIMYKNCPQTTRDQIRGKGFTLYTGLLDDIAVDRFNINQKVKTGFFDLIVVSDIQNQYGWFVQFRPWLTAKNTVILDGSDTAQPYPARGFWWRRPHYWFLPKAHKKFLYFKREWETDTHFTPWMRLLPKAIRDKWPQSKNLRHISFGIPEEKIVSALPGKTKDFPVHIVDAEVAGAVPRSATSYAFSSEEEYYGDIRQSRFGITTKRAGWDCLRHYEIAANGSVICFRSLEKKSKNCAPHGLKKDNTIAYNNAQELMEKVRALSTEDYAVLQAKSLLWAKENSTKMLAKKIIVQVDLFNKK